MAIDPRRNCSTVVSAASSQTHALITEPMGVPCGAGHAAAPHALTTRPADVAWDSEASVPKLALLANTIMHKVSSNWDTTVRENTQLRIANKELACENTDLKGKLDFVLEQVEWMTVQWGALRKRLESEVEEKTEKLLLTEAKLGEREATIARLQGKRRRTTASSIDAVPAAMAVVFAGVLIARKCED